MKQKWSAKWSGSTQRRKQRKYRKNAPLHVRQKFVSAHLIPTLRRQHKRRSVPLRKGDEVEIITGDKKKSKGKVERVNLNKCRVYIEGINVKKADGSEVMRGFEPSNLMITKLNMEDKMRQKAFNRADEAKKPREEKKDEKKKPVKKEPKKAPAKKSAAKPKKAKNKAKPVKKEKK